VAICCGLLFSSCVFVPAEDSGGSQSGAPGSGGGSNSSGMPSPELSSSPSAAVTIAGVDVDGRNLTAAGLVSGLSESGGTCEFVIFSPSTGVAVKVSRIGVQNVRSTSCGSVQAPIEKFSRGNWNVVLNYTSNSEKASSVPLVVHIP